MRSFRYIDGRTICLDRYGHVGMSENRDHVGDHDCSVGSITASSWKDLTGVMGEWDIEMTSFSFGRLPAFNLGMITIIISEAGPNLILGAMSSGMEAEHLVLDLPIDRLLVKGWIESLINAEDQIRRSKNILKGHRFKIVTNSTMHPHPTVRSADGLLSMACSRCRVAGVTLEDGTMITVNFPAAMYSYDASRKTFVMLKTGIEFREPEALADHVKSIVDEKIAKYDL